ncbi:hypothetical protein ABC365_05390 [Brevundimonas sp. 3P9-tot-E]|uniref:hypothetical protein n=1 Tax=unclassified Brevundimonas TaxID=2622653 RepID=UPI0039A36ED3
MQHELKPKLRSHSKGWGILAASSGCSFSRWACVISQAGLDYSPCLQHARSSPRSVSPDFLWHGAAQRVLETVHIIVMIAMAMRLLQTDETED